jgi:hypothetical protein
VELGSQIYFTTNDTTNTLEKITLRISMTNKSEWEDYTNPQGKHIKKQIYSYAKEKSIMQEVELLNEYLIELFGENYDENFDIESSLLLNSIELALLGGNLIEQTSTK